MQKKAKKSYVIKNDVFGILKNTFKWKIGETVYKIPYSDFQLLLDKFITIKLLKENLPEDCPISSKNLKTDFSKFVMSKVKFRKCLWCSQKFLSTSFGQRKCIDCKINDPNSFMVYQSWGETIS